MEKVFATPKVGVLVRQENGTPLQAAGEIVERSSFWLRRERDGDVTLGPLPSAAPEPTPAAAAAKQSTKG